MSSSITVHVTKPSRVSRLGVDLKNASGGGVYVNTIRDDSIFVATELQAGMIIESINGISCASLASSEAANILRQVEGEIFMDVRSTPIAIPSAPPLMAVSSITVTAIKPTRQTKVGIGFKNHNNHGSSGGGGQVYINSVKQDGIFTSTLLQQGMIIDSINGVDCSRLTSAEAANLLREAEGEISVVAHEESLAPITTPLAHVIGETYDEEAWNTTPTNTNTTLTYRDQPDTGMIICQAIIARICCVCSVLTFLFIALLVTYIMYGFFYNPF